MNFLKILKHLLPNSRAWNITRGKNLRYFFEGLSGGGDDAKSFFDNIWLDIFPATTRELDAWESQFALKDTGLSDTERRDRLDSTWKALGGQDPRYIQDTLQANGFDVYVHEWWEPGSEPSVGVKACVTPRSPLVHLRREYTKVLLLVECGAALAQCGEAFAEAGNSLEPKGYPLVNKVFITEENTIPLCGEFVAAAGEEDALCGNYIDFVERVKAYTVPLDPNKWPYFLYIGGENFGTIANISPTRKNEFEELCLKICPTHLWLGVLVEYN